MVRVAEKHFHKSKINPKLNVYGKILQDFSFVQLMLLLSSPKLFLKAIYYLLISFKKSQ